MEIEPDVDPIARTQARNETNRLLGNPELMKKMFSEVFKGTVTVVQRVHQISDPEHRVIGDAAFFAFYEDEAFVPANMVLSNHDQNSTTGNRDPSRYGSHTVHLENSEGQIVATTVGAKNQSTKYDIVVNDDGVAKTYGPFKPKSRSLKRTKKRLDKAGFNIGGVLFS